MKRGRSDQFQSAPTPTPSPEAVVVVVRVVVLEMIMDQAYPGEWSFVKESQMDTDVAPRAIKLRRQAWIRRGRKAGRRATIRSAFSAPCGSAYRRAPAPGTTVPTP